MLTIIRDKLLGEGCFGTVFEGIWKGIPVAIKRIPVNYIIASCEQEENALKLFDHENVIKLLHVEKDKDFRYVQAQNYMNITKIT